MWWWNMWLWIMNFDWWHNIAYRHTHIVTSRLALKFLVVESFGMWYLWYLWLCITRGGSESVQISLYASLEAGGQPRTKIFHASFSAPFSVVWKESKLQVSVFSWQDPWPRPQHHVYPSHRRYVVFVWFVFSLDNVYHDRFSDSALNHCRVFYYFTNSQHIGLPDTRNHEIIVMYESKTPGDVDNCINCLDPSASWSHKYFSKLV